MATILGALGHGLSTVGRAYDYITPGQGASTLTDVGRGMYGRYNDTNNPLYDQNNYIAGQAPLAGIGTDTRQTADPYSVLGASTTGGTTTGSGSYSTTGTGSGPSAADLALYDQAISQYENQLPAIDRQLGIAHSNVDTQFGQKSNELQTGYNSANQQYNQNTGQNQQQYVSNKNQVRDTASAGLRGLLRTLGAYGAGGTDADNARNVVARSAAQQASGAGQTFGQNQQNLDTSWGTYGNQFENEKKQLNDWRTQQMNSADQTSLSTKQNVLQTLANLRAQRAGGNTAEAQAALSQANGMQNQIDELGRLNPTYTGATPTYKAPDVASYTVNPNAQVEVAQNANDSQTNPWLTALLGKDKKQQQPAY